LPGLQSEAVRPLAALHVVDLSTTEPGALVTQFLADAGAEVVLVERPGGCALRAAAGWPALGRGKRSIVANLEQEDDRATVLRLIARADVVVDTFRLETAERLGLTPDALGLLNPRLVSASITGCGRSGPWRHVLGYEGLVMAKLGMFHAKRRMVLREGPAFVSVPFATWGAAQSALHGILAALLERESSGLGQHVDADLVRGATMFDTWAWFTEMVGIRWPEAFEVVDAFTPEGEPQAPLVYPLLTAPTKDGYWLQFAQVQPRLLKAMIRVLELEEVLADPKWKGFPVLESQELRSEMWETMIDRVARHTLAEWEHIMEREPDVNAEVFREGTGILDHPQLVHDGRVVVVNDPDIGPVRQPSTLVHANERPLSTPTAAPRLDDSGPRIRAEAVAAVSMPTGSSSFAAPAPSTAEMPTAAATPPGPGSAATAAPAPGVATLPAAGTDAPACPGTPPLAGITVLELGVMFAAPFGATLLSDLGARVIKVESLEGDGIRSIMPFPEVGGARVMQGKESIALDLGTEAGRQIVHQLAKKADVVLQGFRAGAAVRAHVDAQTLQSINPELVYVNAPGYGTSGPYGTRPAYAPSIAAAGGLALTDIPDATKACATLGEIKQAAVRLGGATAVPSLQADGMAALGVASAMLLGLVARARNQALGPLTTTMLGTTAHALIDRCIDYAGRPPSPTVDSGIHGFNALYRLYRTSDGWIFLAAPKEREWVPLVAALGGSGVLAADKRFATAAARLEHDADLASELQQQFASDTGSRWERDLTAVGIGCTVVHEGSPEALLQTDPELSAEYAVTAHAPVFDQHLRMSPAVRFTRSRTEAQGGCLLGEGTDRVLRELGYDEPAIAQLHEAGIVA